MLSALRLQLDVLPVFECQAAKTSPFGLVLPFFPGRNRIDEQGFHRRVGRTNGQRHTLTRRRRLTVFPQTGSVRFFTHCSPSSPSRCLTILCRRYPAFWSTNAYR